MKKELSFQIAPFLYGLYGTMTFCEENAFPRLGPLGKGEGMLKGRGIPDFPGFFGLSDEHVVAVLGVGPLIGAPFQKFGDRRVVNQIEQEMVGT